MIRIDFEDFLISARKERLQDKLLASVITSVRPNMQFLFIL